MATTLVMESRTTLAPFQDSDRRGARAPRIRARVSFEFGAASGDLPP
jgi:hypothetical protein